MRHASLAIPGLALSLAIVPVLVLYVIFSRQFLRGLTDGALK